MTDLRYTISIEVEKPSLLGQATVFKASAQGRLYEEEDAAEQLERACAGLVGRARARLRKAAERKA